VKKGSRRGKRKPGFSEGGRHAATSNGGKVVYRKKNQQDTLRMLEEQVITKEDPLSKSVREGGGKGEYGGFTQGILRCPNRKGKVSVT